MRPTFFSILTDDEYDDPARFLLEIWDDVDMKYPYGHRISNIVRREIQVSVENITNAVKHPIKYEFWKTESLD